MNNPKKANSPDATGEFIVENRPCLSAIISQNKIMPPSFSDGEIDRFVSNRVCARCYGDLTKFPAPDRAWHAICLNCMDAWRYSTISRRTAEMRGQQAIRDYLSIRFNPALADLFPSRNVSERQILVELGF